VITSNTSSLGEIAGDAAETIDPTSTDDLTEAIVRLAVDRDRRRELAERGLRRARTFSWTQTAKEMLAVYHRAAGMATAGVRPPPIQAPEQHVPVKSMSRERSL
jgi:glycosyltransferase involved in cell wall biosynthesis